MDKWRETVRRGLLCAVVVVVLVACTPGGEPIVTESPSASGSPGGSVSPSPTASVDVLASLPAEARSEDLDGAIATAEFFLTLYAPMFHSGDTRLWEALSGDECGYCADAKTNAERVKADGWTATGGDIRADSGTGAEDASGGVTVVLPATTEDAVLFDDQGVEQSREAGTTAQFTIRLTFADGHWSVDGVVSERA